MDVVSALAAVALALLVVAVVAAFVIPRLRGRRPDEPGDAAHRIRAQIDQGRSGLMR